MRILRRAIGICISGCCLEGVFMTSLTYKSVPHECPARVFRRSVPQECSARVSQESAPQQCPTASYSVQKSVARECPTRVFHKSVPTRVSYKSTPQECPTKVRHKSVKQWLAVCFRVRVRIRVRGLHLVYLSDRVSIRLGL